MVQISFAPNKAYPSIPTIGSDIVSHSRALEAIREALQIHERRSKDVLNSFVRVEELIGLGLVELEGGDIPSIPSVVDDGPTEETPFHHHNTIYIKLDGTSPATTGEINIGAGILMSNDQSIDWLNEAGDSIEMLVFGAGAEGDGYFEDVSEVAAFEGANNDTTYTSPLGIGWTFNGNAELSTTQFFSAPTSISLDGTSDTYLNTPNSIGLFGLQDFTVECHVYPLDTDVGPIMGIYDSINDRSWRFWEGTNDALEADVYGSTTGSIILSGSINTMVPDEWTHIALCRSGTNLYLFANGVLVDSATIGASETLYQNGNVPTEDLKIGSVGASINWFNGFVDNVRITKGVARYTTNFTPPGAGESYPTQGAIFVIGDSAYYTQIDGLVTNITSAATDIDGTLNVDGAVDFQSTLDVVGDATFAALTATSIGGLLATDRIDMDHFMIGVSLGQPVVAVASNGSVITLSLNDSEGVDLRFFFSSGVSTLDTEPTPVTIVLTPGTDISPILNYIYVLESTGALAVSTSSWPSAEYAPVATVLCQSAVSAQTDGFYKVHAWTDHAHDDYTGHLAHANHWIRSRPAGWVSGALASVTDGAGVFDLAVSSGEILQLHPHAFPSFDTSTGSEIMVVNDSVTAYVRSGDLTGITLDSTGTSLNNKYFNVVVWGVVSEDSGDCQIMINLPTSSYVKSSEAQVDIDGTAVYDIPADYAGTGFLIARLTMRLQGTTYTEVLNTDLRGKFPSTSPGGSGGGFGVTELIELTDVDTAASTANFFLGTPDGSTGQYSGRAIVADDLPDLSSLYEAVDATIVRTGDAGYNKTEWDTAYGWGDHVSGGYALLSGAPFTGDVSITNAAPKLFWYESDAAVNTKLWDIVVENDIKRFRIRDDTDTGGIEWMNVTRSTHLSATVVMNATFNITDALTAVSYGGIIEANLLDKSADEAYAGVMSFSKDSEEAIVFASVAGPIGIRWDSGSSSAVNISLNYRTGPETMQFERMSDSADILMLDPSDLSVTIGGDLSVTTGGDLRIYDASNADHIRILHDGNNAIIQTAGTDGNDIYFQLEATTTAVLGVNIHQFRRPTRFYDAGVTDYAQFSHDGIDFNTAFMNTSVWNVTGHVATYHAANFYVRGGDFLRVYNSSNLDYAQFDHNGVDFNVSFNNTTDWNILDGVKFKVFDSTNTDLVQISHNGSSGYLLNAGGHMYFGTDGAYQLFLSTNDDVYVNIGNLLLNTNNKFLYGRNTGGTSRPMIGMTAGDVIKLGHTSTPRILMESSLLLRERAAAEVDAVAYGQLWVKNTTPCELWFTDDAGLDTQIV